MPSYALLCGEKFNQRLRMWRKMTNIRYAPPMQLSPIPNLGLWSDLPNQTYCGHCSSSSGYMRYLCRHKRQKIWVGALCREKLSWSVIGWLGSSWMILPIVKTAAKSSWGQHFPHHQHQYPAKPLKHTHTGRKKLWNLWYWLWMENLWYWWWIDKLIELI